MQGGRGQSRGVRERGGGVKCQQCGVRERGRSKVNIAVYTSVASPAYDKVLVFFSSCLYVELCSGYLQRFAGSPRKPGEMVYLINSGWFQCWMEYTGYQVGVITRNVWGCG